MEARGCAREQHEEARGSTRENHDDAQVRAGTVEDQLRLLVSSVKDYAIFMLDTNGCIATWNAGAEEIKGYRAEEAIGKHLSIFYTPEDLANEKPQQLLRAATAQGRVESEGWRVRKDGSRFWADVVITAVRGPDGELKGFGKVTRDLTSRKEVEDKLQQSQESLFATLYSIGDAVLAADESGNITRINPVAERLTGWLEKDAIGRPLEEVFNIINETTRAKVPNPVARVLAEGVVVGLANHTALIARDGTERPIADSAAPIRDTKGVTRGAVLVFRDVTEERRAEEALRQSEERLRLMIASIRDYAIFMLDPDGRVATWNPGAECIKGYREEEVIGTHFSRFYPPEDIRERKPDRELELAAKEGRVEDEGWRLRKDGSRFWANVVINAVHDSLGHLIGFTKVTRDLTERRSLEQERLRVAQAHEAIRLRDDFLSIASHELKTPLAALQLQLEGLREQTEKMDEKLARKVLRASRAGRRMEELVEAVLDVSRIATGRIELDLRPFDIADAVQDVVDRLGEMARRAGCDLSLDIVRGTTGAWDRLRVEQVLTNLLSNALKYAAGRPIEVSLRVEAPGSAREQDKEGDVAVVQVRDWGPGIPEKELPRIFGRFERLASMRHYGGLGLGLYVARQIIEAHGGSIEARNAEGGGACFVVRLPAVRRPELWTVSAVLPREVRKSREEVEARGSAREQNRVGEPERTVEQQHPEKKLVLLVEDDRDIREVLAEALEDAGHSVVVAANGVEALTKLKQHPLPCAILLDLTMPMMDGVEFRNVQKQEAQLANIPVIVISAYGPADPGVISADDYVSKPIDLRKLLAILHRHCRSGAQ